MSTSRENDQLRAAAICQETRTKENASEFRKLYDDYHTYFKGYAYKRLYDKSKLNDVLQEFWLAIWNGAICKYEGKSTLKTFLTSIIFKKIIDYNNSMLNIDRKLDHGEDIEEVNIKQATEHDDNKDIFDIRKEGIKQLINKALVILADTRPDDAYIIRMKKMKEMSYDEILKEMRVQVPHEDRQKEIDRLKHQYSRAIPKLKIIVERLMQAENMTLKDYLGR